MLLRFANPSLNNERSVVLAGLAELAKLVAMVMLGAPEAGDCREFDLMISRLEAEGFRVPVFTSEEA